MNLFVIYLGGTHSGSLIELHDIRFVAANSLKDTYDYLRSSWWGNPGSLHIDAWGVLTHADGYDIQISKETPPNNPKLFFINLGGYDPHQFTELHKNIFVVANNKIEAKQKSLAQVAQWQAAHRDNLYEVDALLNINKLFNIQGYNVHLTPQNQCKKFEFTCCYKPIGKTKTSL